MFDLVGMSRHFKIQYGYEWDDLDTYEANASGSDVKDFLLEEADIDYLHLFIITPVDNAIDTFVIRRQVDANHDPTFVVTMPNRGTHAFAYSRRELYNKFREKFPGVVGGKRRRTRRKRSMRRTSRR